jgi:hypothetical protein
MGGVRTRTLKSELRLARLTVVVSLSVPYAFRQLCIADVSPADLSCSYLYLLLRWFDSSPLAV